MKTKMSFVGSILGVVFNSISLLFYAVATYLMYVIYAIASGFAEVGGSDGEATGLISLFLIVLLLALSGVFAIVNIVLSALAIKPTKRGAEAVAMAKKRIVAAIVFLFILSVINVITAIMAINSIILIIGLLIFAIIFILCAVFYIVDLSRSKRYI